MYRQPRNVTPGRNVTVEGLGIMIMQKTREGSVLTSDRAKNRVSRKTGWDFLVGHEIRKCSGAAFRSGLSGSMKALPKLHAKPILRLVPKYFMISSPSQKS